METDPQKLDPIPPSTSVGEPKPLDLPNPTDPRKMADTLKDQAAKDRDDGVVQEWLEDRLIEALPLEKWAGEDTEEEIVEVICDAGADVTPELIDFLKSRV